MKPRARSESMAATLRVGFRRGVCQRWACGLGVCLLMFGGWVGCVREAAQEGTAQSEAAIEDVDDGLRMADSSSVVRLSAGPVGLTAQPGEQVTLQFDLEVDRRWHLYAHEDTAFYGIDLTLGEDSPLQDVAVAYPVGRWAEFFGEQVQVLDGRQRVTLTGTVAPGAMAGRHQLQFEMAVQACDDRRCLAPAFMPCTVTLEVP